MKLSKFFTFLPVTAGDIDPSMNLVEVTPEAKAELAKIENKIGDFICRLCKEVYDDAFGLAQHRLEAMIKERDSNFSLVNRTLCVVPLLPGQPASRAVWPVLNIRNRKQFTQP